MTVKKSQSSKTTKYIYALGRRKEARARVRLYKTKTVPGTKHNFIVNGLRIAEYFPGASSQAKYLKPLVLTDTLDKISFSVKVEGSGKSGQLGAVVHGVARALDKLNRDAYHQILKKAGLLTRDPREKERRKVGTGGKARRQKQSPKR